MVEDDAAEEGRISKMDALSQNANAGLGALVDWCQAAEAQIAGLTQQVTTLKSENSALSDQKDEIADSLTKSQATEGELNKKVEQLSAAASAAEAKHKAEKEQLVMYTTTMISICKKIRNNCFADNSRL